MGSAVNSKPWAGERNKQMVKHRWFKNGDGVWCVQIGVKPYRYYLGEDSLNGLAAELQELRAGEAEGKQLDDSANMGFGPVEYPRGIVARLSALVRGLSEVRT